MRPLRLRNSPLGFEDGPVRSGQVPARSHRGPDGTGNDGSMIYREPNRGPYLGPPRYCIQRSLCTWLRVIVRYRDAQALITNGYVYISDVIGTEPYKGEDLFTLLSFDTKQQSGNVEEKKSATSIDQDVIACSEDIHILVICITEGT